MSPSFLFDLALSVWRRRRVRLTIPNYSLASTTVVRQHELYTQPLHTAAAVPNCSDQSRCARRFGRHFEPGRKCRKVARRDGGCKKPSREDASAMRAHLSLRKGGCIRLFHIGQRAKRERAAARGTGAAPDLCHQAIVLTLCQYRRLRLILRPDIMSMRTLKRLKWPRSPRPAITSL